MLNIYLYPKIDYKKTLTPNPYIMDLESTLSTHFTIVNEEYNTKGVLDFFMYVFKTDCYIFNWIEDLPLYRFGKLQVVFFLYFLVLCKLFNKKIVWVLHNKYSHFLNKNLWTDLLYSVLMANSHLILTHSKSGIEFCQEYYPKRAHKIKYIFHPIKQLFTQKEDLKMNYDFLIWGSINPYKGVLEFLEFAKKNKETRSLKILVAGKCANIGYKNQLKPFLTKNILMIDRFFEMEEIVKLASQSRFILFTHKSTSVLSSGSLIDSIRMGSRIIGPDIGAFKDLKSLSFIETYNEYKDIPEIHKKYLGNKKQVDRKELQEFCKDNSWEKFGDIIGLYLQNC